VTTNGNLSITVPAPRFPSATRFVLRHRRRVTSRLSDRPFCASALLQSLTCPRHFARRASSLICGRASCPHKVPRLFGGLILPSIRGITVIGAPNHPDLLQAFTVLPSMPGPLAHHSREIPRAPCEVHALQRFPLVSSPDPFGSHAALPFSRTSRPCSAGQSLVRRQCACHRPVSSPGLRASQLPRGTVSLRLPESSLPTVTPSCRVLRFCHLSPCCHSTSPSVLPPHLRVFSNRNCD